MSRKKPRELRPEEKELWQQVARTATPLHTSLKSVVSKLSQPAEKEPKAPAFKPSSFEIGAKSLPRTETRDIAPTTGAGFHNRPLRMDKKTYGRMKRGKADPEARIDLHGMTAAAAKTALTSFILRSHGEGKRLVLVITGKGREKPVSGPIPIRHGILRQELPHWLSIPPLASLVLQVAEAHQKHGGGGAFYVYLARRR